MEPAPEGVYSISAIVALVLLSLFAVGLFALTLVGIFAYEVAGFLLLALLFVAWLPIVLLVIALILALILVIKGAADGRFTGPWRKAVVAIGVLLAVNVVGWIAFPFLLELGHALQSDPPQKLSACSALDIAASITCDGSNVQVTLTNRGDEVDDVLLSTSGVPPGADVSGALDSTGPLLRRQVAVLNVERSRLPANAALTLLAKVNGEYCVDDVISANANC